MFLIPSGTAKTAGGRGDQAESLLCRAISILETTESPLEYCRTILRLAEALYVQDKFEETASDLGHLSEALKVQHSPNFLIPDLLRMKQVLDFAVDRDIGNGVFLSLVTKVGEIQKNPGEQ